MLNPEHTPRWGSDPEAFFQKNKSIIGSEKLIPENGLRNYAGRVVRDGVQFELNPISSRNVADLGRNISRLFAILQNRVKKSGVKFCFDGLVEVSREELDSLSPKSRVLGCMPSMNFYENRPITVDPLLYPKRSSGGHIHVGIPDSVTYRKRKNMVPVFDSLVGLPSVLLDRDPGAAERRENYGRAGEFRLPGHGLEYRTTSNYWLRNYTLMSFVFGMAQIAYAIGVQSAHGDQAVLDGLAERINLEKMRKAIDTNDFASALRQFKRIVPYLRKQLPKQGFQLHPKNLDVFIDFAVQVEQQGLAHFFPTEYIVGNWVKGEQQEFVEFLQL